MPGNGGGLPGGGDKPPGVWAYQEVYDADAAKQAAHDLLASGYKVTIVAYKVIKES